MAEYVILEAKARGNGQIVVVHTATPAGSAGQQAGLPWSQVLVEWKTWNNEGTLSEIPPLMLENKVPGRQASLDAGTHFEWRLEPPSSTNAYEKGENLAARVAKIEAEIVLQEAEMIAELEEQLRWWSVDGSVTT